MEVNVPGQQPSVAVLNSERSKSGAPAQPASGGEPNLSSAAFPGRERRILPNVECIAKSAVVVLVLTLVAGMNEQCHEPAAMQPIGLLLER